MRHDLIEEVARTIYQHQGGVCPKEFKEITGSDRRLWETDQPWDAQPNIELCEWERDECRFQAKKVLEFLKANRGE